MSRQVVIKYNGEKALRRKCRYIKGEFYEKDVDCFKLNGRWNRINNGRVFYDYSLKKWNLFSLANPLEGYVDYKEGVIIKGFFTETIETVKIFKNNNTIHCLNEELALKLGFKEDVASEYYTPTGNNNPGIKQRYKKNLSYNIKDDEINNSHYHFLYPDKKNYKIDKFLNGFQFGFEFETSDGYIKQNKLIKHGVVPLKDGSLRDEDGFEPYEYTTIPLTGYKGVCNIVDFSKILNKCCNFNNWCSLHIHISGLKPTKSNIIKTYHVIREIQNELLLMFPYYKTAPSGLTKNNKNYCMKLKAINLLDVVDFDILKENYYNYIFKYVSCGANSSAHINKQLHEHPMQTSKWNISSRYYIVNFVPFLFSNKRTLEFRVHEATFDYKTIINWLFICISILKFIQNSDESILYKNINFKDVLSNTPFSKKLYAYYLERVEYFNDLKSKDILDGTLKNPKNSVI